MSQIHLTNGNDSVKQDSSSTDSWNDYFGEQGDDRLQLYNGTVIGGAGNDYIEGLASDKFWLQVQAAYWDSPAGVRVDLALGFADDGHGGRDTLLGVNNASGSNHDDWFNGNAADNHFWGNGGHDVFNGGAGTDTVTAPWIEPAPGQPWRPALLGELRIEVSVDGRTATVKPLVGSSFEYTLTDVEKLEVWIGKDADGRDQWTSYPLGDFIRTDTMAEQAIAGGGEARWNAGQPLGSAVTLSFSFVTQAPASGIGAAGFRAFTPAEQQLVRDIFSRTAAIANISFIEVADAPSGNNGQLRFGVSQQATTKGSSWQPGQSGDLAGDVWMDRETMLGLAPGSEGYAVLLHEIGHALGLRHPRNVEAGDAYTVQLRELDDRSALTAMSQASSSDGLFRADWGLLDVQALRYLYGTHATHAGDDIYRLGARDAGAQFTLVDDGGIDTLDATALQAGARLDLGAARLSSVGITSIGLGAVDNLGLASGSLIENAVGSAYDDVLLGNALDNQLTGGPGNDWLDGGAGNDTGIFSGRRADYAISTAYGKVFVQGRDGEAGFDTLIGIERLQFADAALALSGSAMAADVSLSVDEDKSLAALLPDPSDSARSAVSYRLIGAAYHGATTISAAGLLSYTPQQDFHGSDTIEYELSLASGGSNRYLAYITVQPINDAGPVGRDGNYLVLAGEVSTQARLPIATDIDADALSYTLATEPAHGEVVLSANGEFSYRAAAGYSGSDSFRYTVSDGMGGSASYSAGLDVAAVTTLRSGSAGNDAMAGQAGADGYLGLGGDDRITGGGGDDVIDGGSGIDTAVFSGKRAGYVISSTSTHWAVKDSSGKDGSDRLVAVERLAFGDGQVALDLDGAAGHAAQIIRALLGPQYLQNKQYVGIGIDLFDKGMDYAGVVALALGVLPSFAGDASNQAFVQHVYRNVIGVSPSAPDLAGFTGLLDTGVFTQASLALVACQFPLNVQSVELAGLAVTGLDYTVVPS